MFSFLNLDLSVYRPGEKLFLFTHFCSNQSFSRCMQCRTSQPNIEYLKTFEILKVSSHFGICSFVQISRNFGFFCKLKYVLYFGTIFRFPYRRY